MWESLADPNQAAPKTEPQLAALYSDIRDQISQEAQIIEVVFPHPVVVMQVFLQRVFAQVIQSHLEKLISAAQGSSTLAFLRVLALARFSTAQLVNDIKAHDFFRSSSSINPSTSEAYPLARRGSDDADVDNKTSAGAIQAVSGGPGISALSGMLDQQLDELFGQHLDNSRYVERECKSLTELYASYLLQFARWHRATNKAKPTNTIFDRMVNQISSSANGTPGTTQTSGLKSLLKLSGISADDSTNPLTEGVPTTPELCESDGQLDLNVVEKLLTWHAESVGRMIELSSPSEVPENVFSLLKTLAESFCKGYVETALETSLAQFSSYDLKAEPSLKTVTVIKTADMAMHLWQRYVTTTIVPLAAASVNIRREMSIFNNHTMVRIENKINSVAQKAFECNCYHHQQHNPPPEKGQSNSMMIWGVLIFICSSCLWIIGIPLILFDLDNFSDTLGVSNQHHNPINTSSWGWVKWLLVKILDDQHYKFVIPLQITFGLIFLVYKVKDPAIHHFGTPLTSVPPLDLLIIIRSFIPIFLSLFLFAPILSP
ncbi:hypothetical protein PtA15_11A551 [Puccinia triticina]|uniref:Exocyst complex component Sec10-like alpha-helical bundle domain-containing protein n=1 Tax=Puccinia triticina TaxID=208348 RepID=A0ABY7CZ22_9BASI|nr:uncharacterized protein PtA15_11A551 [Puccinia triticina]WAQ89859.1 hypothetical protein PtA15_11A551 [Puccinia triticina]